jgi:hypothetical protein
MPDAGENRRLAEIETDKADNLPPAKHQDALRKKAFERTPLIGITRNPHKPGDGLSCRSQYRPVPSRHLKI